MSYTMTFDASHKVHRGGSHVAGFTRHIARDADLDAGFKFAHANPNIDPSRTHLNESVVNDGNGDFRELRSVDGRPPSHELEDYLNRRLKSVKRKPKKDGTPGDLRKDAVVLRPIILQLDPKWFDDHCPGWREHGLNDEALGLTEAALAWACDEFGQVNVVGGSIHLDEYSPQLQVLVVPVTADGRLSQKDFFKGPSDLKRQHRELREHMEAAGYDVEHRVTARSTEHLDSAEYQARADRLREAEAELHEARIDDAEALSWHRSDAGADILAARAAADEELAELHSLAQAKARRIVADADLYGTQIRDLGYKALDRIDDEVKRQPLRENLDAALAQPVRPVEDRHAAAARRDRARKEAARATLLDSDAPQQTRDRKVHDSLG